VTRYGDIGDASDQICDRHRAMCDLVATVDAVGAIVAQHVHVSGRHPHFRFVGKGRLRIAGVDIGFLGHHAVDDGAAALDGDAVALDSDDAFDIVKLLLLGMNVDGDLAAAGMAGAIVGGVGEKIFTQAQRGLHACTRGVQPQQPARRFRVEGINARPGEDQAGEHKSARVGRPATVALMWELPHPIRARNRVDHDVEPQPDEERETDCEHPEPRQHPHHREHQ
jgi:hypothetical protein